MPADQAKTMGGEHPLAAIKRLAHWEVEDDIGMLRTRLACISAQADKLTEQCALAGRVWQALDRIAAGPQGDDSYTRDGHREAVEMARAVRAEKGDDRG